MDLEFWLYPYHYPSQLTPLATKSGDPAEVEDSDGQKGRVGLEVQVSFPFDDKGSSRDEEKVKEVIEIPITGNSVILEKDGGERLDGEGLSFTVNTEYRRFPYHRNDSFSIFFGPVPSQFNNLQLPP